MKQILLLMLLMTNYCFGQSFTVPELIKIIATERVEAETMIVKKEFQLLPSKKDSNPDSSWSILRFAYNSSDDRLYADKFCNVWYFNTGEKQISYEFNSQPENLNAREYLKSNGFKLKSTAEENNCDWDEYEHPALKTLRIMLKSCPNTKQSGPKRTMYTILVYSFGQELSQEK